MSENATQFNDYVHQYELAETLEQKRLLAAHFAAFYDSLSTDDKQAMNQAMHPSLLTLKAWAMRKIDPLLAQSHALLARKSYAA